MLTLSQVELHPAVGKNIKFSLRICKATVAANRKKSSAYKRMRSDLNHEKTSFMNKIKSKGPK
jgi:hypothetical protein